MVSNNGLKYQTIVDDLSAKIRKGDLKSGERLPSQNHLIKEYGVALATIRQALTSLQRNGLIESTQGKGTYVRDMRASEPGWVTENFIGLALLDTDSGDEPTTHECFISLNRQVQKEGKELLVRWLKSDEKEEVLQLGGRVDVLLLYNGVTEKMLNDLLSMGKRVVVVGGIMEGELPDEISSLYVDPIEVAETGLDFLHSCGHRNITLCVDPNHGFSRQVITAYEKFTRTKGLRRRDGDVFIVENHKKAFRAEGPAIIEKLIDSKPDAIFWPTVIGASYCANILERNGVKVPEDISVLSANFLPPGTVLQRDLDLLVNLLGEKPLIGFNDLSAVYWDTDALFSKSMELALSDVSQDRVFRQIEPARLHVGETVAMKSKRRWRREKNVATDVAACGPLNQLKNKIS